MVKIIHNTKRLEKFIRFFAFRTFIVNQDSQRQINYNKQQANLTNDNQYIFSIEVISGLYKMDLDEQMVDYLNQEEKSV